MLLCSVLFLIANCVLFLLFLVRFTSKSRILRVNKESCKIKNDSVLQYVHICIYLFFKQSPSPYQHWVKLENVYAGAE